jgi:hypothetical protein
MQPKSGHNILQGWASRPFSTIGVFTTQTSLPEYPHWIQLSREKYGDGSLTRPPHPLEFTVDNLGWAQVIGGEK